MVSFVICIGQLVSAHAYDKIESDLVHLDFNKSSKEKQEAPSGAFLLPVNVIDLNGFKETELIHAPAYCKKSPGFSISKILKSVKIDSVRLSQSESSVMPNSITPNVSPDSVREDQHPLKNRMSLSDLQFFNSHTMGDVLTILDAVMPEGKQKESAKSLVKKAMWANFDIVRDWYYANYDERTDSVFPFNNAPSVD